MTQKISRFQLYAIMFHFMLGAASVISLANDAKQNAWLSILFASIVGTLIFIFVHGSIIKNNCGLSLVKILEKHLGKKLGKIIAFLFVLYFMALSLLVFRHCYEMLIMYTLPGTPKFVINIVITLVTVYAVSKGIEIIARVGEIYFFSSLLAYISFIVFLLLSDVIEINNLFPILEDGISPVIKSSLPLIINFPFGEIVVFYSIFSYLNQSKSFLKVGVLAFISITIIIVLLNISNITTIGPYLIDNATYPTLKTIRLINVRDFIQRLDSLAVLIFLTSSLFKLYIFFYVINTSLRDIFNTKNYKVYIIPTTIIILIVSTFFTTENYTQLIYATKKILPYYISLPFEIIIPIILLIIILVKKYILNKKSP